MCQGCTGDATGRWVVGQSSSPLEYHLEKHGIQVLSRSQVWICDPTSSHTRHISRNQCAQTPGSAWVRARPWAYG